MRVDVLLTSIIKWKKVPKSISKKFDLTLNYFQKILENEPCLLWSLWYSWSQCGSGTGARLCWVCSVGSRQNMSFFWYFSFVHVKIPINTYLTKLLVLWREPFFSRGEIVEYLSFHNKDYFLMGPCSEICDWALPVEVQSTLLWVLLDTEASVILFKMSSCILCVWFITNLHNIRRDSINWLLLGVELTQQLITLNFYNINWCIR